MGRVTPATDPDVGKKTYQFDPQMDPLQVLHDPHLSPTLIWAGKKEHTSFEIPTVSLHVHERIYPRTIIKALQIKNGKGIQDSLFDSKRKNIPHNNIILNS